MSIGAAAIARWNATGLNASIKALFPSSGNPDQVLSQEAKATGGESGSAAEEALPRARLVIPEAEPMGHSSSCRTWRQTFFFYVFCATRAQAVTHRKAIRAAFENSHKALTNPFVISGAEISDLDLEGFSESVRRHDLSFTEVCFSCLYSEARILPS